MKRWTQTISVNFPKYLPVDVLIIFLWTNDTNNKANKTSEEIVSDLESYMGVVKEICEEKNKSIPKIIYIAPPYIKEEWLKENSMFSWTGPVLNRELPDLIEKMAKKNWVYFFDSSKVVESSLVDWVHLSAESNVILWKELGSFIEQNIF